MFSTPSDVFGLQTFIFVFAFAVSLTITEIIRGYLCYILGDRHGYAEGRLTTNPIDLVDFMGTIAFPIISILLHFPLWVGWCHPVQVDINHIKFGKLGNAIAILANPIGHFILCVICLVLLQFSRPESLGSEIFVVSIQLNASLTVLRLLPILPLPGGQLVSLFLPLKWRLVYEQHETYTPFIILILFLLLPMLGIPVMKVFQIGMEKVLLVAISIVRFLM